MGITPVCSGGSGEVRARRNLHGGSSEQRGSRLRFVQPGGSGRVRVEGKEGGSVGD